MTIYLASASPRRKDLLERLGFTVSVHPADVDESMLDGESPVAYAERTARLKASVGPDSALILAADTVVHLDDAVLHKPSSRTEAGEHLHALSGRTHRVTTGVCVRRGAEIVTWSVTTDVTFRELTAQEIEAYLATGEADDKAGAYGIQGIGGTLVAAVSGSWTNVMGLPIETVIAPLTERGAARWTP